MTFMQRRAFWSGIESLAESNVGDFKPIGEGISELRINYGPRYRVHFLKRGREAVTLLAGGGKSTQTRDIKIGLGLAQNL
jgi:putative addiction module killer protein